MKIRNKKHTLTKIERLTCGLWVLLPEGGIFGVGSANCFIQGFVGFFYCVALSLMKRGYACFLLVLVFVGLVILSKPVMAQNLMQVEAYGPSTYTIMPSSNFMVWVTVSLRVTYSGSCILVILIKTSESAKTGLGDTITLDETLLDGQPHSQTFEFVNLLTAPDQGGIWSLYARAYIQDISGYNMVVAEIVLTPFFTLIESYCKIDSIWLTTSTSKQTVHIVTDWYESPITIIAIVAVVAVPIVIALMKRKPMPEQTQLERCA